MKTLDEIGEEIRALLNRQAEMTFGSDAYENINDEVRRLVIETDGKAQCFVDAFERVIH